MESLNEKRKKKVNKKGDIIKIKQNRRKIINKK